MSIIQQQIAVTYGHLMRFIQDIFSRANLTLRDILADQVDSRVHRAVMVMDEALCRAQPSLLNQVPAHFERHEEHEMNLPIVVKSIYELRDRQAGREQSVILVRA